METIVSSRSKEVRIGHDLPFVIIGERINPTGRKKLAAEMAAGDFSRVIAEESPALIAIARKVPLSGPRLGSPNETLLAPQQVLTFSSSGQRRTISKTWRPA